MFQIQTKTRTKVSTAMAVAILGAASLAAAGMFLLNRGKIANLKPQDDYLDNVTMDTISFTKVTPAILANVAKEYRINTDGITSIQELLSAIDEGGVVLTRPTPGQIADCCDLPHIGLWVNNRVGDSFECGNDCSTNPRGYIDYYKGTDGSKMWVEYDEDGNSVDIGSIK